jgi:drug/metabolite transporter (DMT)-like permease
MGNDNKRKKILGVAAAVCLVVIWSGWIVVSRLGVTHHLTVYDLTGLRFSIAAMVILPYILWRRPWRGLPPVRVFVLSATCGVPYALLGYFGFSHAPAAHGGIFMNGCLPLFTALVGWIWMGQRSRASQLVGLGIILLGVILVGYEGIATPGGGMTWLGDILFLLAISLFAVFMVANKAWGIKPGQVLFSGTIVSAMIYVPIWMLWLDSNLAAAPRSEIMLQGAYQGLVPSVMGISLANVAIRYIGANTTSVIIAAVPAVAALVAIPVLNEIPGLPTWIGMIAVTTGILMTLGIIGPNGSRIPAHQQK